jgi:ribonuclease-3
MIGDMYPFFQPDPVEAQLKIKFNNKSLLTLAFIHRSFWNENQSLAIEHNERLEFLGDSVLGLLIADFLFSRYPDLDEGFLSSLRSQLVDAPACASYVQKLGIADFLLLGKGEQMNHGKGRESILADLFEALIGALYLDQGLEGVKAFFFSRFQEEISKIISMPQRNWKAELQDYTQKKFQQTPVYKVIDESGPPHKKWFKISVHINEQLCGEGEGASKKEGQTEAAKQALLNLDHLP